MAGLIGAIDQGTTSTRFIITTPSGDIRAVHQLEHKQIFPKPGWVEHDAREIWRNTQGVIETALLKLGKGAGALAAIGVTNQRETTLVWDRKTGEPLSPAIVWMDTRTQPYIERLLSNGSADWVRAKTGLPLATYFSAGKLAWLLDTVPTARAKAERGEALFGTMDSWLIWNLTGGVKGGRHLTDVTNASRTLLMNLATLQWDQELLEFFNIPRNCLPEICSSSEIYGSCVGLLSGVPIGAALGDQQASLFGQACLSPGEAKNTYGTGCFLLMNIGDKPHMSRHGLLTTVAYQLSEQKPVYAL
ncbi:MAG: glycerol kinase, partial [Methylocystaceae bacterium]|nr:glycerol kinase [Methylocystaceae bacterium]